MYLFYRLYIISLSGMTESSIDDRPRHHILALYSIASIYSTIYNIYIYTGMNEVILTSQASKSYQLDRPDRFF